MDALAHCLEAYCGPFYHPLADGIAVEGMRLVKENLPRAYKDGKDLEARGHMMSAAAMGATAFQKALGATHSLAHPISSHYDTHHGMTCALFMPYVLQFNRKAIDEKLSRAAAYMGLKPTFQGFFDHVMELRTSMKIPHSLAELKIDDSKFEIMSAMAPKDPTAGGNPIPLDQAAARRLYEQALAGKL
jgi:alcohol dehydrogenase